MAVYAPSAPTTTSRGNSGGRPTHAKRRQTARELGLGRYLRKGYHGPRWTAEELGLLGPLPDETVARRIGWTPNAVRQRRELLGIPRALA
jgi:hypothetical protein